MKTQLIKRAKRQGYVLLLTLVSTGLVGFLVLVYLNLSRFQNNTTMRSQAWNVAIPVVEAGLEHALMQLRVHGATNIACDGWTQSGNLYYVLCPMGDNYYFTTISNYAGGAASSAPVIESRAFVRLPIQVASAPGPMLAAFLNRDQQMNYLGRGVRVTTRNDRLFSKGLVAKGQIDINGNNIASDSFDSSDPAHSTYGRYDSAKRKANGDVATNLSLTNSLNVGNAKIYGRVATGPRGTVAIGPNGSVGDLNWQSSGARGIQAGRSTDDMNVDFPDVEMPFVGGAYSPTGAVVNGTWFDCVLGNGNYQLGDYNASDKKILVRGNATLLVTGNFKLTGNSSLIVAPNACLNLYVSGAQTVLAGNGVINMNGNATNFFYHGLPGNTSVSLSGNGTFTGLVYAPNADFTLNGGGSSDEDFIGASVTKSAKMNGHYSFHYDEALNKYGPFRGFVITSWNEMTPQEVANSSISLEGRF